MATLVEAFDAAERMATTLGRRYADPAEVPPEVARVRAERALLVACRNAPAAELDLNGLVRLLTRAWVREDDRAGGHAPIRFSPDPTP